MIGLLVIGFVANELVRPVNVRHHIPAQRKASDVTRATAVRLRASRPTAAH